MNKFETSSSKVLVDTKPMFASTWMVLFAELRRNYNEWHLVEPENKKRVQPTEQKRPGLK
ncbi:MAG: hypothetical protein QNK22_02070 [Xanthomonadales bacterium]|nr:hypothetical protein [Xanthomonadales bacterium]